MSPPEKRARSYSPPIGNHVEPKLDLQESLLGQALEGGPTIHTTSTNNIQVSKDYVKLGNNNDALLHINVFARQIVNLNFMKPINIFAMIIGIFY